ENKRRRRRRSTYCENSRNNRTIGRVGNCHLPGSKSLRGVIKILGIRCNRRGGGAAVSDVRIRRAQPVNETIRLNNICCLRAYRLSQREGRLWRSTVDRECRNCLRWRGRNRRQAQSRGWPGSRSESRKHGGVPR